MPSVDYLEASSLGRVRSVPYETPMPNGGIKTNELKPTEGLVQTNSPRYSRKIIVFRRKTYRIASLVAEAFHGPRPDGLDVSHLDQNSFNNRPENLCYETRKENINRRFN